MTRQRLQQASIAYKPRQGTSTGQQAEMSPFDFDQWCEAANLSKATIAALKKEDLMESLVLWELSEWDIKDNDTLSALSLGEWLRLRKVLAKLHEEPPGEDGKEEPVWTMDEDARSTRPVNSKDMVMDDHLWEQLSAFQWDSESFADLFDGVTIQDNGAVGARDVCGPAAASGKKPLYIPDYVTSAVQ